MSEPLNDEELHRRWARTLGQTADWERVDPQVTQKPVEVGGTLSHLATVSSTLSGGGTLGGTLSGGTTIAGTLSGGRTLGAGGQADGGQAVGGQAGSGGPAAPGTTTSAGYELVGELGRGGMGVVYRARQRALAREIALKFIRPEQASQGARERFVSEALVNGLLDHPNIVPVHELGATDQGEVYLAMKLVGGRSWKALLHPQSPEEQAAAAGYDLDKHLAVLNGVGNAIAFAHSRGIVHRDLKPENVMVGEFGEVLVMDWGIAVDVRDAPDADQRAQHKSTITAPSGTPSYMAPELAEGRGKDIGPWTDVYLLGAILHEILTGRPPHTGPTLMAVLLAASRSLPTGYPAEAPTALVVIARKAMARDIRERHQGVGELQAALAQYVKNRQSEVIANDARARLDEAVAMPAVDAAARNRRYGAFAEAVAGFRQALLLWSANDVAQTGERTARTAYARAALAAGDLGLAEAQLEPLAAGGDADALRQQVARARADTDARDRGAKRNRLLLAGALVVIVAGLGTGVVLVKAEQSATATERDKAVVAKQDAQEQRKDAETQRAQATAERDKAVKAEALAVEQRTAADAAKVEARRALTKALRQRANDDRIGAATTWEAESLRAAAGDPASEELQRHRLGRHLAAMPVITALRHIRGAIEVGSGGTLVTPDGRYALLRSIGAWPDCQVRLWDLRTLQPLGKPIPANYGPDHSAWGITPDGATVLEVKSYQIQPLTPDGEKRGTADYPTKVQPTMEYYDQAGTAEASCRYSLPGHPDVVVKLPGVAHGDGHYTPDVGVADISQVATVSGDGHVTLWSLPSGRKLGTVALDGGAEEVRWTERTLLLRDKTAVHLIARADGSEAAALELPTFDPESTIHGDMPSIERCLLFDGDRKLAVLRSGNNKRSLVDLYDLASADHRPLVWMQDIPGELAWIQAIPGGARLFCQPETFGLSGYEHSNLVVMDWLLPTTRRAMPLMDGISAIAASADGAVVVAVAGGKVHRLRGADRAAIAPPVALPAAAHPRLAVSGDGTRYAVAVGGDITVYTVADGAPVGTAWHCPADKNGGDEDPTNPYILLSRDGRCVIARDTLDTVRWRQPDSSREARVENVWDVTGDLLLLTDRRVVRPWLADDRPVTLAIPDKHPFSIADVSRDGQALLTITGFKETPCYARVWDLATGQPRTPEIPYQMYVLEGSFNPDASRFVVVAHDFGARIYDAAGAPAAPPMSPPLQLGGLVRFSPDGRTVVFCGFNGESVTWWDAASGEQLDTGAPDGGSDVVAGFGTGTPCFLPDGSFLGRDGAVSRLAEAPGSPDALALTAALQCGWRVDASGAAVRLLPEDYQALFDQLQKLK